MLNRFILSILLSTSLISPSFAMMNEEDYSFIYRTIKNKAQGDEELPQDEFLIQGYYIPNEVVDHILSFLSLKEKAQVRCVSTNFQTIVDEAILHSEIYWDSLTEGVQKICQNYFTNETDIRPWVIPGLVSLEYWHRLSTVQASSISKKLQGTKVRALSLERTEIGDEGVVGFSQNLPGTDVDTLCLGPNKIGSKGAAGIDLKRTKVREVDLRDNRIDRNGAINF